MTTTHPNGIAPVDRGTYRLGGKGGRMAQAWQYVWDRLDRDRWYGSMELSRDAAQAFGLKPVSVSEMLGKMRAAGVIEQTMIVAPTRYTRKGKTFDAARARVHYRIAVDGRSVDPAEPVVMAPEPSITGRLVPPAEQGGNYRWEEGA